MSLSTYNLLLLVLFIVTLYGFDDGKMNGNSSIIKCQPCNRIKCVDVQLTCKGEKTKGVCGCCEKCAKVLGENCGGVYYYLGKCSSGLYCRPLMKKRYRIRKKWPEIGRCVRLVKKSKRQSDEPFRHTRQCHPKCSPDYCRKRPRAICSAAG